jgi:hypothetical protein
MSGSCGKIEVFSDFTGIYDSVAWGATNLVAGDGLGGSGIGFASVNEGSFASTVDEPGGILAITTDTGDNDNAVLLAGPFRAADGQLTFEARFKHSSATTPAIFAGFSETMALDTPVMPAEFATATMTYNGSGGMVGWSFDIDATTNDWRALMGDGGAAVSGSANGTRANATTTADRWLVARVELGQDTSAKCWLSDVGHVSRPDSIPELRLVKSFDAGLTATDLVYAVLMIENRTGAANVLEVDYFSACGYRDWSAA